MVRAKAKLIEVSESCYSKESKKFVFQPVCDNGTPENQSFAKWTPSGRFEMTCNNPAVMDQFKLGEEYYVDFTAVPVTVSNTP